MTPRLQALLLAALAASVVSTACGKKGPPLPPLVQLPQQPADVTVVRRGDQVDLTFRVPKANVDGSTPASIARVDVFAWTVPGPVDAAEVLRRGARVGSVAVNTPADPDEPEPKTPAARGNGVEQDAITTVTDSLPAAADPTAYRTYVIVGVSQRGRRGTLAPRVAVPLVPLPPSPAQPQATYDEKAITLTWAPPAADAGTAAYRYVVRRPDPGGAVLTPTLLAVPRFTDTSIEWEKERCYDVRTVRTVEGVRIESAASPVGCVTPHDTFPPAPPEGLISVGAEGAVSLIWTASPEADVAGYIVLRAVAPATQLAPITPVPITDTNFRDAVPAGSRATYAVQAVDRAGNRSAASGTVTETAR